LASSVFDPVALIAGFEKYKQDSSVAAGVAPLPVARQKIVDMASKDDGIQIVDSAINMVAQRNSGGYG